MTKTPSLEKRKGVLHLDGVSCCACGATSAPPARNTGPVRNVCLNCWTEFGRQLKYDLKSLKSVEIENNFNGWLSRRVILDLKRLEKNGMLGRCEAVSAWTQGNNGYQCAKWAVMLRDDRPVCKRHGTIALDIMFINSEANDPYNVVRNILVRLCLADDKITAILKDAIAVASKEPASKNGQPIERDYMFL